jgi:glutathione peroxidase
MIIQTIITIMLSTYFTGAIHNYTIKDVDSNTINLASLKGKKVLIVNVASECGFTSQYKDLQNLHETYGDKLVVLGFPCNDFGGQEPCTETQIKSFCEMTFGVTFAITEKISIKNNPHPIYQYLTQKEKNGVDNFEVKWNFHKFLIDEKGQLVKSLGSGVNPMDKQILDWVKG